MKEIINTMTGSTQEELVFPITGGLLLTTIGILHTPIQPTITPRLWSTPPIPTPTIQLCTTMIPGGQPTPMGWQVRLTTLPVAGPSHLTTTDSSKSQRILEGEGWFKHCRCA